MRLFVVGKLGELIKKVIELEDLIKEHPTSILITELAQYQELLKAWPVRDDVLVHRAVDIFRFNIAKLKQYEKELRIAVADGWGFELCLKEYLNYLDNVRSDLSTLNEIGMFIGPSPFMELEDDKVAESAT